MALSFTERLRYLTLTDAIAMVDEQECSVNTPKNLDSEADEEIMIPYNRVLYIAWDKDVGTRLKKIRNDRDMSQPALAKLTKGLVSLDTIKSLEMGRADSVSREKLDILLRLLDSDVRSLFPTATIKDFQKTSNS